MEAGSQSSSCSVPAQPLSQGEMVKLNKEIHFTQDLGPVDSCVIIECVNLCAYFAPSF